MTDEARIEKCQIVGVNHLIQDGFCLDCNKPNKLILAENLVILPVQMTPEERAFVDQRNLNEASSGEVRRDGPSAE